MLDESDKQWIRTELRTELEAMETRLSAAFHTWASPMEARQRGHVEIVRALGMEVDSLKDRVKKLEEK